MLRYTRLRRACHSSFQKTCKHYFDCVNFYVVRKFLRKAIFRESWLEEKPCKLVLSFKESSSSTKTSLTSLSSDMKFISRSFWFRKYQKLKLFGDEEECVVVVFLLRDTVCKPRSLCLGQQYKRQVSDLTLKQKCRGGEKCRARIF